MSETSLKASVSGKRREQLGKGEKGRRTLEQIVFTPTVHHHLSFTTKSKEPGGEVMQQLQKDEKMGKIYLRQEILKTRYN